MSKCARGRVRFEHPMEGHYEVHLYQEAGIGSPTHAYICLTAGELKKFAAMATSMLPSAPDQVEHDFTVESDPRPEEGTD